MIASDKREQDHGEVVRTSGRSMAPLIADRSIVRIFRVGSEAVVPGDIIVFRRDGKLFAHRLIAVRGSGEATELREKGDNCLRATWIAGSSLLGKAVELRHRQSTRQLDGVSRRTRVQWLTSLSRLEADVIERYVALRSRRGVFSLLKGIMLMPAAFAAPLRFLLLRMLLTAYPHPTVVDSAPALRYVAGLFRSRFSQAGHKPGGSEEVKDWSTVFEMAAAHGVLPLVVQAISSAGGPRPPAWAQEPIKKATYRVAMGHTMALQALRESSRALSKAGVPYAVLKGPFLYEWLYRDMFPREYEDMDILVPRGQVTRALEALQSAGYELTAGRLSRMFLSVGHFHFALHSARPGWPPIELHWSLVDRCNLYRMPDDECLSRIRSFGTGPDSFTVLAIEDQLLYLCLHAVKHGAINYIGLRRGRDAAWFCRPNTGNRLLWFADIALLLWKKQAEIDWQVVRERAALWNVTEEVYECLQVLGLIAPESAAKAALTLLHATPIADRPAEQQPEGERLRLTVGDRILDWAMRMNPSLLIRPIRILLIGRLFFPSPGRLLAYHRGRTPWLLPWLYFCHPLYVVGRMLAILKP
jgi:hypothetical protein